MMVGTKCAGKELEDYIARLHLLVSSVKNLSSTLGRVLQVILHLKDNL